MLVSSRMSRGKPSTSSGNQRKALSENDIVPRSAHLHPPPSPPSVLLPISRPIASRVKRSFRIELKTLDVRSNSAHEDEWAANCGLSRMSRGSPPAIFHPRLPLCYKPLSLSLSLSLFLSLSPFSFKPLFVCSSCTLSLSLFPSLRLSVLHPSGGNNSRSLLVSRLYQRSCFGARAAASIMRATLSQRDQQRLNCIRDSRTAHKFSSPRRGFLLNAPSHAVIRRVFSFHPSFPASFRPLRPRFVSRDFARCFRDVARAPLFIKAIASEIDDSRKPENAPRVRALDFGTKNQNAILDNFL